ncbi:MAG: thymidylate kinase [bacterium]|nr:MAG: thymidylate kinase [bacterium]
MRESAIIGRKGIFIVFEGLDGAGKTTQSKMLVESLKKRGIDTVYLKEPTSGRWGKKIREIAVRGRADVTLEEELDFFIKDRREDVENNILPALGSGRTVVMDRYIPSNMAYQGALGFDVKTILEKNAQFPQPDAVFFLDVAPDTGLARISRGREGGTNEGYEKPDYLEKVFEVYRRKEFNYMTRLNGSRSADETHEEIMEKVLAILEPD